MKIEEQGWTSKRGLRIRSGQPDQDDARNVPFKAMIAAFVKANLHHPRQDWKDYNKLQLSRKDGSRMGQVEYRKDGHCLVRVDNNFIDDVAPHFDACCTTAAIQHQQQHEGER